MKVPARFWVQLGVGSVFVTEGIQKFLNPSLGHMRFSELGFPLPQMLASIVGAFEMVCGVCILAGFYMRFTTIPLILIMIVALGVTKLPQLGRLGIWRFLHEARLDFLMLCVLYYLNRISSEFKSFVPPKRRRR